MNVRTSLSSSRWASVLVVAAALVPLACNNARSSGSSNLPVGTLQVHPAATNDADGQRRFIVGANTGGNGSVMKILAVEWGRIVDVYATVPGVNNDEPVLIFDDFLAAAELDPAITDPDFRPIERDIITGAEKLTINHDFGSAQFDVALDRLTENLQQVIDKSLDVSELPPFTAVSRNAAIAVTFDDLIEASTVTAESLRVEIGYPPSGEFSARVVPDLTRGDLVDGVFYTTRVLVDFTVSDLEAAQLGTVANAVGLPEAQIVSQPNVVLRIPTRQVAGQQFVLLRNLDGRVVSFNGNGSTDPFASSLDVVRAFRSGGRASVTTDLYNGFLPDSTPPQILSAMPVTVTPTFQSGLDVVANLTFATAACAVVPKPGDVVAFNTGLYGKVQVIGANPSGGTVADVQIEIVDPGTTVPLLGVSIAEYRTPWTRATDQITKPECWVGVQPPPGSGVGNDIQTSSTFTLQFSEPMDPTRLNAFDSFQLLYGTTLTTLQGQVTGELNVSADLARYTLQPLVRLRHTSGSSNDVYRLRLPLGAVGPVDLAGNALVVPLLNNVGGGQEPTFRVKASEATQDTRSLMLNLTSVDEDDPQADPPIPEFRGQLIYDLINGRIRPRSVSRLSAICDLNTPMIIQDATAATPGAAAQTRLPFVAQGCRLMTMWRHADLGFDVVSDAFHNLDVEGLNWAPASSGLQVDTFPQFQMSLSHSLHLPDEVLDTAGLPLHPNSSLSDIFSDNVLDPVNDPLRVVHPKSKGYFLAPVDVFQAATGTIMAPWPLNQDVAAEDFTFYTWRDTGITAVGQPNNGTNSGQGVKLGNEQIYDPGLPNLLYILGEVPTIGLPLLMDFRVYPSAQIVGANQLLGFFAIASNPPGTEVAPFFTAYTAGGFSSTGIPINIDPDQQFVAAGGTPGGVPGNLPRNQVIFFGQGDFVTRVNRVHSRWFECAPGAAGLGFSFAEPVVLPPQSGQPAGTQLIVQYRGATGILPMTVPQPWADANNFDAYGDDARGAPNFTVTHLGGDEGWKNTMAELSGSQFFQVRVTMISNEISGATPSLEALGFAFGR